VVLLEQVAENDTARRLVGVDADEAHALVAGSY
jgi:hypothetical protein